jgi:vitamin B12 transporter
MNTAQKIRANPDRDENARQFLAARLERRLDADLSLGVRVSSRHSRVDYDDNTGVRDNYRFKRSNDTLGVFARTAPTQAWASTLDISVTELSYDDLKNGVPYQAGDGSWKNGHMTGQQQALRWSNEYQLAEGRFAAFGLERNDEKFKAEGDNAYNMKRQTQAAFVGLTQKLQAWTLQLNLRHDEVTVEHADAWSNANHVSRATTGLLGLGYQLNPQWRLTATTSMGFRAPTAYDISSNALLRMETHRSHEAGVSYAEGASQARLVAFATASHDAIGYDSNFNVMNIGDTRNQGVEASLRTRWQGYAIKMSAVAQDPWSVTNNERLARRAREYVSVDVSRPVAAYDVGMKVMAVGSRKDSHYSTNMLGGYSLWSFYASRKVDNNWTARVRLDNVFDKQYQLAYGYNTPGRGIYATLQYSPK